MIPRQPAVLARRAVLLAVLLALFATAAHAAEIPHRTMSVYPDIVKQLIKRNWRYQRAGTEANVSATLEININQNGEIIGSRLVTPSGVLAFDDSVLRAVRETEALPPPSASNLSTLRITFNLQELRK